MTEGESALRKLANAMTKWRVERETKHSIQSKGRKGVHSMIVTRGIGDALDLDLDLDMVLDLGPKLEPRPDRSS